VTATAERTDLPVHLTRFVGREPELSALGSLLRGTRLLTLTGAGGSGKTRLASELAMRAGSTFERIGWVDFAPLADPLLVGRQAADALHVPELPNRGAADSIAIDIGSRSALVVFDNCEHLVDACAALAETLLRACQHLTVIATSREALGIPSETSWLVPPMESAEATQLFVERAQGASATFRLTGTNTNAVNEICRRLDRLPLAIELAAARVRALSPEQIAERLDDAFRLLNTGSRTALPRHRTLRGVIEWSVSLLTPLEQSLLTRLSVFHGGFTLEAAEEICAADPLVGEDILDGVAALVEKSLVVMDAGEGVARYHLLETVRQYGMERLTATGEDALIHERHARYFVEYAERTRPMMVGGQHQLGLTARVKADNDNLRAACTWSLADAARKEIALRLAGALFWYWYSTALFHDAREFIDAVRPQAGNGYTPRILGGYWQSAGLIALAQGSYTESRHALSRALELQREAGDGEGVATTTAKLGAAFLLDGDAETADKLLIEADELAPGQPPVVSVFVNFWRGWSRLMLGDTERARALFMRNRSLGTVADHHTSIAHSLTMLGYTGIAESKFDEAQSRFVDAVRRHRDLFDVWGLSLDLDGLAIVAISKGDAEYGVALLAGVEAMRERTGMALPVMAAGWHEASIDTAKRALSSRYDGVYSAGAALSLNDLIERALEFDADRKATSGQHTAYAPPVAPTPAVNETTGLEVEALGPLKVTIDGRVLDAAEWGSARSRELLVFLLVNPDGATKEQVGHALWPDSSPAQLRNNFHVTLHRLRKTLGNAEWIVTTNDRYAVDAAVLRKFDATMFEGAVQSARRALKRKEAGAVAGLERALAIYRGEFLDGEPVGDWHLETRDHLQNLAMEGLMALGAAQVEEDRHARAVETYRLVLARDELHEEALRALMAAHAAMGDRTLALRAYQRFAERLKRELESEPSRETRALFERLR
jgi:predicted ATPase/DNA-binding SARP family transcriptional activator